MKHNVSLLLLFTNEKSKVIFLYFEVVSRIYLIMPYSKPVQHTPLIHSLDQAHLFMKPWNRWTFAKLEYATINKLDVQNICNFILQQYPPKILQANNINWPLIKEILKSQLFQLGYKVINYYHLDLSKTYSS